MAKENGNHKCRKPYRAALNVSSVSLIYSVYYWWFHIYTSLFAQVVWYQGMGSSSKYRVNCITPTTINRSKGVARFPNHAIADCFHYLHQKRLSLFNHSLKSVERNANFNRLFSVFHLRGRLYFGSRNTPAFADQPEPTIDSVFLYYTTCKSSVAV